MGTSLHNKIYLGRHHMVSRPVQWLAAAGSAAALALLILRAAA